MGLRSKKIFIVTDNPGRLGNLMNRHGHLLAYALENQCALVDYSFLDFAAGFPRLRGNLLQGTPDVRIGTVPLVVRKTGFRIMRLLGRWRDLLRRVTRGAVAFVEAPYPTVADLESAAFAESIEGARIVLLAGYLFEARTLFAKHAGLIRSQFAFAERVQRSGGEYIAALREPGVELVGVHLRHTDYRQYDGGRWFYTAPQYAQVMRWVARQQPDRRFRFVVCSDEPQSAEAFAGLDVHLHSSDYWTDLYVLTQCSRLISSSSSFSRAAAFLGKIPLLRIFDPDLPASHQFLPIEVLEEGWVWEGQMIQRFGRDRPGAVPKTTPCLSPETD
jgi:hypothetical protein